MRWKSCSVLAALVIGPRGLSRAALWLAGRLRLSVAGKTCLVSFTALLYSLRYLRLRAWSECCAGF